MVHFWTLLFWYDFSLNDLKYVSINLLQILCPIIPLDKAINVEWLIKQYFLECWLVETFFCSYWE